MSSPKKGANGLYTVTVTVGDGTPTSATTYRGTISHAAGSYTKVLFTNKRPSGNLDLTKTVAGLPKGANTPDITFTVKKGEAVFATFTLKNDFELKNNTEAPNGTYTLKEDARKKLTGIELGTYTVTESVSLPQGYTHTATYGVEVKDSGNNEIAGRSVAAGTAYPAAGATATLTNDGDTATVAITNTYAPSAGNLVIRKQLSGNALTGTETDTFYFKVRAIYSDGTESHWSNFQRVTLFEGGHNYQVGDINHDGTVTIADVTDLIDALLSGGEVCEICADVNGDSIVTIADVTDLIDNLLSGH